MEVDEAMSTCAICLKPVNFYSKPYLYRQTTGHNACVSMEKVSEMQDLTAELEGLEGEILDLVAQLEELTEDPPEEDHLDVEAPAHLDPEQDPMETL